ncbi:MAG: hypothetical protein ACLFUF_04425 [Opitutales bacterium]
MGFLKKHPLFILVVLLLLAVCGTGIYLAFQKTQKVAKEKDRVTQAEQRLQSLRQEAPAPSKENIEAAQANIEDLESSLYEIREDLQSGANERIEASTDGVGVMASIQEYISDLQDKVEAHENDDGEPSPIETPDNFAFGFQAYIDEASVPDDADAIPKMDKQRQILRYILNQLIGADPVSIEAVKRELVERGGSEEASSRRDRSNGSGFTIDSAISARVPDAIETMAFQVTFTGYTDALRAFLNNLATFELPIVVRSIDVSRPEGITTTAAPEGDDSDLESLFGGFDDADSEEGDATFEAGEEPETQKPVIEENISEFTVTLEFIDLILPSDSENEEPDSE